jgi:hypothetical protein
LKRLSDLLGNFLVDNNSGPHTTGQKVRGRFSDVVFSRHLTMEYGNASEKTNRYQEMVMAMVMDQWRWIRDRKHVRVIDQDNAIQSLRIAVQAKEKAENLYR